MQKRYKVQAKPDCVLVHNDTSRVLARPGQVIELDSLHPLRTQTNRYVLLEDRGAIATEDVLGKAPVYQTRVVHPEE